MANKRDLHADLRICEAATPGPWEAMPEVCGVDGQGVYEAEDGGCICEVGDPYPRGNNKPAENMRFIAEARTGWPHAIQRAIDTERRISGLEAEIAYLSASKAELIRQLGKQRAYAYFLRECLRNGVQIPYDYNFSAFKEVYGGGETQDYEI